MSEARGPERARHRAGPRVVAIEVEDGPDVVLYDEDTPALFYVPERCYPLPRNYWDEEALADFEATVRDEYYGRTNQRLLRRRRS